MGSRTRLVVVACSNGRARALRPQRLGTGQHPRDDLPWGHVFEGRVRNRPRRSWQSRLARVIPPCGQTPIDTPERSGVALGLQLLPEDRTVALSCLPSLPQISRRATEGAASRFAWPSVGTMHLYQPAALSSVAQLPAAWQWFLCEKNTRSGNGCVPLYTLVCFAQQSQAV